MINIMVVDDHPSVLNGLQLMLSSFPRFRIAGLYADGNTLLDALEGNVPDVILMDIQMPGIDGIKLCNQVTSKHRRIKVIAITGCEEKHQIKSMMQNGASGYLLKTADKEVIAQAIESVVAGEQYIHEELKQQLLQEALTGRKSGYRPPALTKREKEILRLIANGQSNQEIADTLYLSIRTVENHRFNLMQKLDVKNAAALVREAIDRGLA